MCKPVVPVDATPLRRVAWLVVEKLEDPELELPEAILKTGTQLSMSELAEEVKKPLEAMERAMLELEALVPSANKTLEEKQWAHAAVDEKSGKLARFLEGLYELTEHDVMAATVRPSSNRRKDPRDQEKKAAAEAPGKAQVEGTREVAPAAPVVQAGVEVWSAANRARCRRRPRARKPRGL